MTAHFCDLCGKRTEHYQWFDYGSPCAGGYKINSVQICLDCKKQIAEAINNKAMDIKAKAKEGAQ